MSPPAYVALAETGPCYKEQVAKRTFNIIYFDLVPDDPVFLAQHLQQLLPLSNEREVRTLWVSRRGKAADLRRTFQYSDWVDIRVPKDSNKERAMLALRCRSLAAHHQRVLWAIRIKVNRLTARFAEGTFRRKVTHPEIAEAVAILDEDRNRKYLRNKDHLEWIVSGLKNGGPLADLLYREKMIDLETCVRLATAWQARVIEDHLRIRQRTKQPVRYSAVSSTGERLVVTRSYRLDTRRYCGFRIRRTTLSRPT